MIEPQEKNSWAIDITQCDWNNAFGGQCQSQHWHDERTEELLVTLPDDQEGRLRCFTNALRNWKYRGYVTFKPIAEKWLLNELPGLNLREIARLLHEHVVNGGKIHETKERRPEWDDFDFHYDLRVRIGDRHIYFETTLDCNDPDAPDDPTIRVVSVRDV
jgi:hypothetical protein